MKKKTKAHRPRVAVAVEKPFMVKIDSTAVRVYQCGFKTPVAHWLDYLVRLPRVCDADGDFAGLLAALDLSARDTKRVWEAWQKLAFLRGWRLDEVKQEGGVV